MIKFLTVFALLGILSGCSFIGDPFGSSGQGCGASTLVTRGDTVYAISRRCNVSVRDIIEANNLSPPYIIRTGTRLRIPGANVYSVKSGDTLLGVSRKLGVEFRSFARINGKSDPYRIYVGEKLKLPGSFNRSSYTASRVTPSPQSSRTGPVVLSSRAHSKSPPKASTSSGTTSTHPALRRDGVIPPDPKPLTGKGFSWPIKGTIIQNFGPIAKGQSNDGINISAKKGTRVKASENGVIVYSGNELTGFGNLLLVKHAEGWMTAYAHNDQMMVKRGDVVKKGQTISTVGTSGNVTKPQLHFELRKGTQAVDPKKYLK